MEDDIAYRVTVHAGPMPPMRHAFPAEQAALAAVSVMSAWSVWWRLVPICGHDDCIAAWWEGGPTLETDDAEFAARSADSIAAMGTQLLGPLIDQVMDVIEKLNAKLRGEGGTDPLAEIDAKSITEHVESGIAELERMLDDTP